MKPARGFTLIELMVVISIIAILSIIGITVFSGVQKSARDTKRRADLHALQMGLEQYKLVNGKYPIIDSNKWNWFDSTQTPPWIPGLDPYMMNLPVDPINTSGSPYPYTGYQYTYNGMGYDTWFVLIAHLESPNSSDLKTKCIRPDGQSWGSTNAGAGTTYPNTYWVCSQL